MGKVLMVYCASAEDIERLRDHIPAGAMFSEEDFSPMAGRAEAAEQGRRFLVSLYDQLWGLPPLADAAQILPSALI